MTNRILSAIFGVAALLLSCAVSVHAQIGSPMVPNGAGYTPSYHEVVCTNDGAGNTLCPANTSGFTCTASGANQLCTTPSTLQGSFSIDGSGAGGPGGGGQASASTAGGGAGGCAQWASDYSLRAAPGSALTVAVGVSSAAGTAGNPGTSPSTGQQSSISGATDPFPTLVGGLAGLAGSAGTGGTGGAGATALGGAGGSSGTSGAGGTYRFVHAGPGNGGGGGGPTAGTAGNGSASGSFGGGSAGTGNGAGGGGSACPWGVGGIGGVSGSVGNAPANGFGGGGGGGGSNASGGLGGSGFLKFKGVW